MSAPSGSFGGHPDRLGDYHILREIGSGGMGVVYEAEHDALKNRVALKVMHPRLRGDATYLQRFHREARSAARLHHTNIVPVFDYGEQDGVCYYAMQYIAGVGLDRLLFDLRRLRAESTAASSGERPGWEPADDLAFVVSSALLSGQDTGKTTSLIEDLPATKTSCMEEDSASDPTGELSASEASGPSSPSSIQNVSWSSGLGRPAETAYFREVARIGAQVADALDYAHQQGVIHRDVKPSNLTLDAQGNAWVMDFGLAKLVEGDNLSHSHDVVGTLRFMAPERFRGVSERRGDIYSLGATLYELLTLQPAFADRDQVRLIDKIVNQPPRPARQYDRRIPRDLETLVQRALAKDPKDRFATAGELRDELRLYLESRPIRSRPAGRAERFWRWCKRNPALAAASILAAALTTILAIGSTVAAVRLKSSRDEARFERARAEENFQAAREAVDDSFTKISESVLLNAPGLQPLRKQLLQDALKYYQRFAQRLGEEPGLQAELAATYLRLARITSQTGSNDEALKFAEKARDSYQSLAPLQPENSGLHRDFARSIAEIGLLHHGAGRRADAKTEYEQAIAILQSLAASDPNDESTQNDLAQFESGLGRVLEALTQRYEARTRYANAMVILQHLTKLHPNAPEYLCNLASLYSQIGLLENNVERDQEAFRYFSLALGLQKQLAASYPDVVIYQSSLARCYNLLGISLRHLERLDEALGSYQKARQTWEVLVAGNPSVTDYRSDLAGVINNMANIQRAKGMKEDALRSFREALKIDEVTAAANPGVLRYQNGLAGCLNAIGMLEFSLGRTSNALQTFEQLRTRMQAALVANPNNIDANRWLTSAWHNTADTFMSMGRAADAADAYRQAIQYKKQVVKAFSGSKSQLRALGDEYLDLAAAERALGHRELAATTLWELRELYGDHPESLYKLAGALAQCLSIEGKTKGQQERSSQNQMPVEQIAERALDILKQAVAAGYHDAGALRRDACLAPLAARADFQVLVGDLAFPTDPFSHHP